MYVLVKGVRTLPCMLKEYVLTTVHVYILKKLVRTKTKSVLLPGLITLRVHAQSETCDPDFTFDMQTCTSKMDSLGSCGFNFLERSPDNANCPNYGWQLPDGTCHTCPANPQHCHQLSTWATADEEYNTFQHEHNTDFTHHIFGHNTNVHYLVRHVAPAARTSAHAPQVMQKTYQLSLCWLLLPL